MAWLCHMATWIWGNVGSGNGLLPDETRPLHAPILTNHRWGTLTFIWGPYHKKWRYQLVKQAWKIDCLNSHQVHTGLLLFNLQLALYNCVAHFLSVTRGLQVSVPIYRTITVLSCHVTTRPCFCCIRCRVIKNDKAPLICSDHEQLYMYHWYTMNSWINRNWKLL